MTGNEFKRLALSLPHAVEKPHFDRSSFRVDAPKGKIFATLPPDAETANIFLTPDEQGVLIAAEPDVFFKVPNKWGDKGATSLRLKLLDEATALSALKMFWRHVMPSKLLKSMES